MDKAEAGYKSVYRLVRNLGFRWKRGVKRLSRKNPHARAEFVPTIQRFVDEANRDERTLIYIDEAHIHCDLDEGYGWAWGGEPYEIPSSSPGLSKKVSLYGAFVFNDPQVVLWKAPRCNTMFTLAFLIHLAKILGNAPRPTIVWDGAPWHKPRWLLRVAQELGFELVLLPPYSPDFMPVEALWRWLREEVTRNQCHDAIEDLVADVIDFGQRLNADPLGLITRLWPKLELREEEQPTAEALPSTVAETPGWEPPVPASRQAIVVQEPELPKLVGLSSDQWARVQRLLPVRPDTRGDPRSRRTLVEAALWKERSGAPWRQLPEAYGPFQTAHHNYICWRRDGTWAAILRALKALRWPRRGAAVCSLKGKAV